MDWSKAKTILLIIFICINAFLAYQLYNAYNSRAIPGNTLSATKNILKENNIEMDCELPSRAEAMPTLQFDYDQQTDTLLAHPATLLELTGKDIGQAMDISKLTTVLARLDINADKFRTLEDIGSDRVNTAKLLDNGNGQLRLYEMYNKQYPIFGNCITVTVKDSKIVKVTMSRMSKFTAGLGLSEIQPVNDVLLMCYKSDISSGRITSISLGYRNDIKEIASTETYHYIFQASPCWRIMMSDGRIIYYNAYTGRKME